MESKACSSRESLVLSNEDQGLETQNARLHRMIELPVIAQDSSTRRRKPDWLRVKLPVGPEYAHVRKLVDTHKLHTICESGNCPNMGECWGAGTATFMILGNIKLD